jgi:hypothetical protein
VKSRGAKASEDRRAEKNTRGHFSYHARLANALKNPTQDSGGQQNDAQRQD